MRKGPTCPVSDFVAEYFSKINMAAAEAWSVEKTRFPEMYDPAHS